MNRRQMIALSLPLIVAPSLAMSQAAQVTPAAADARDPYAPTEVSIRNDFEVGSIVVVSKDFFLYHVVAPGRAVRYGVAVGKNELVWKGKARIGRKVSFTCDGCPPDMKASIIYVSPRAEFTPPVIYSQSARTKLVFLIEARPDKVPDNIALAPGLPVSVAPFGEGGS